MTDPRAALVEAGHALTLSDMHRILAERGVLLVTEADLERALATLTETPSILYPAKGAAALFAALSPDSGPVDPEPLDLGDLPMGTIADRADSGQGEPEAEGRHIAGPRIRGRIGEPE